MGRIFTARDRRLGRTVAIKELLIESEDLRVRFEREARITANLQHPAIVNILEAGTWPSGEPFYAMKLVEGRSLDKVIAEKRTVAERLGLLPAVIACVDALAYPPRTGRSSRRSTAARSPTWLYLARRRVAHLATPRSQPSPALGAARSCAI
jgi:hypothetical protein